MTKHGALTSCRQQRERLVRTKEESDRARATDQLETVEGETCQDTERKRLSEGHSLSGDSKGRTCRNTERNRSSEGHSLSRDGIGTCQDTKRNRPGEGHLPTGEGRGRRLSGDTKNATKRGVLTA